MTIIEARGLRKIYKAKTGAVHALDGLDLAIRSGTVKALPGPNGAGKTTAVKVLTTLTRPDAGTGGSFRQFLSDGWVATRRNLLKIRRVPEILVFTVLQPIMFVLLFSQVYGGAMAVDNYTQFLMAGIFAQTVIFGSTFCGAAMAQDLKDGIMGTGRAVGWRVTTSFWGFAGGVAVLLPFSYAFSWVMALLGMSVRSPEVINNASFMILFPLTFISNAFVPIHTMPDVLRVIAEWNPVSALVASARQLFGNTYSDFPAAEAWTLQHPFATIFLGVAAMLAVFVPPCIRKFESSSSR